MNYDFHSLGVDIHGRTGGKIKTHCPHCHAQRKNKRDKSLSVNIDTGQGKCHYCGWIFNLDHPAAGSGTSGSGSHPASHPSAGKLPAHFKRPVFSPSHTLEMSDNAVRWFVEKRCIPQSVLAQARIGQSDEKMPQTGTIVRTINFHYYENGQLVNTKFRDHEKHFKMVAGAELIPYNVDGILGTPEAIITEGEIDALSFMAIGRTDVVSAPAGATGNLDWLDRFVPTHFEDKQCIYLATDEDEKGLLLRQELLRRFGVERCRIVHFSPGCKDANEHLCQYGVESLRIALQQAEELPIEGVLTVDHLADEFRMLFQNGLESGADTGWEMMDRLCTFELGRLVVLTGVPGHGKSEFTDELVLRLCLRHGWRIGYFSPENMPISYHYKKLAEKLTGRRFALDAPGVTWDTFHAVHRFLAQNVSHIYSQVDHTVDNILARARALVCRRGIRIFVVDPMNCIQHQRPEGLTETQYIGELLTRLKAWAVANGVLLILVAHPRKMNRSSQTNTRPEVEMYDINGSAEFLNKADYGFIVVRDETSNLVRLKVEKVKYKHLGHPGSQPFVYDVVSGRYHPCEELKDPSLPAEQRISNVQFDTRSWLTEQAQEAELFTE